MNRTKKLISHRLKMYDYNLFKSIYNTQLNVFLCGGAILSIIKNTKINDIDLYVDNVDTFDMLYDIVVNDHDYTEVAQTDNAFTFVKGNKKIQIIIKYYINCGSDVEKYFDISVCANAYSFRTGELFISDLEGITLNKAFILNIHHPLATLTRIRKYQSRGYSFPPETELICFSNYLTELNETRFKNESEFYERFKRDIEVIDILITDSPDDIYELYSQIRNIILPDYKRRWSKARWLKKVNEEANED